MFTRGLCVASLALVLSSARAADVQLVRKTSGAIADVIMVDGGSFVSGKEEERQAAGLGREAPLMVAIEANFLIVNDSFLADIGVDFNVAGFGTIDSFRTPPIHPAYPGNAAVLNVNLETAPSTTVQALVGVDLTIASLLGALRADSAAFSAIANPQLTFLHAERAQSLSTENGAPFIMTGVVSPGNMSAPPVLFYGETGLTLEVVPQLSPDSHYITLAVLPTIQFFRPSPQAPAGFNYVAPLAPPIPAELPADTRSIGGTADFMRDLQGALQLDIAAIRKLCSSPIIMDFPGAAVPEPQVNLLALFEQQTFTWNAGLAAGLIQNGATSIQAAFFTVGGLTPQSGPAAEVDINDDAMVDQRDLRDFSSCMLGEIPILGNCFKGDRNGDGRTTPRDMDELLVFITPHLAGGSEPRPAALDPSLSNPPYGMLAIAQGDPLPGDASATVTGFFAIRANGAGAGVIGVFASDGTSAVLLIDEDGMNVAIRTGENLGDGNILSILEVSNITPQGYFAVNCSIAGGQRAVYRVRANSAANAIGEAWRKY